MYLGLDGWSLRKEEQNRCTKYIQNRAKNNQVKNVLKKNKSEKLLNICMDN